MKHKVTMVTSPGFKKWRLRRNSDTHADVTSLVTCRRCGSWLAKRTLWRAR